MSEIGELFKAIKSNQKQDRAFNLETALVVLDDLKIKYERFNSNHFRIGDIDFWATTGLFLNTKTRERGRGIANLLKKIAR